MPDAVTAPEGVPLVVAQLLTQRGIANVDDMTHFLVPDYERDVHDPFLFRDMDKAVTRIIGALEVGETIGVFGDHDADGVSAATIVADVLEMLGGTVEVYIPDKVTQGHGIHPDGIDVFAQKGVHLMISVDCGTSSHEAVTYAAVQDIDVIITDHHHAPEVLPDAYAVINPQVAEETYPFRLLSGTGVAFKLMHALVMRQAPERAPQLKWLLDVVCVGTIADCVPLVGENRTLVHYGLHVLNKTRRVGYQQLCAVGRFVRDGAPLRAETVGYYLAPRINAVGRMRHASDAFALLRETQANAAHAKACALENLNKQRQRVTATLTQEVEQIVEAQQKDAAMIIVAHEEYPPGIVGIVAGRIAEKYHRPTGIFTRFAHESRGSFRSVEGVHIVDVLTTCSAHIVQFGGHEKAAGATVAHAAFDDFVRAANETVASIVRDASPVPSLAIDAVIAVEDVTVELAEALEALEPFGDGNPEPIFALHDAVIADVRPVGSDGSHIKMTVTDASASVRVDAIGFSLRKRCDGLVPGDTIHIAGVIQKNVWNGMVRPQMRIVDISKV